MDLATFEDYLDVKYEERSNMIGSIDSNYNQHCPFTKEDLIPLQDYVKQQNPASLKMNGNRSVFTTNNNNSYNSAYQDSFLPLLDSIDPSIFCQKRLTELTPVKNEFNNYETRCSELPRTADNFISMIETNNFNTYGLDLPETSWILADLDNGPHNAQNYEENYNNMKLNVDNNNMPPHYSQRVYPSSQGLGQLNETKSHLIENDQFINQQPKIDDLNLMKVSSTPFLYECSNQRSPLYENPYFHDYDSTHKEYAEADTNASSPSSCCSFTDDLHCLSNENSENSWVREIKVGKNNRPRGPKCWEFVLRLLQDPASNPSLVKWEDPANGSFRLVEKDRISAIWGNRPSKKKNGKVIKYESFARILRYHYKKGNGMVLPVSEKHLVYKFSSKVMEAYKAGKIL